MKALHVSALIIIPYIVCIVSGSPPPCPACPKGTHFVECTGKEHLCRECPEGTFNDEKTYSTSCKRCTDRCFGDRYVNITVPCNGQNDIQCICDDGYYSHDAREDHCRKHVLCDPGYGVTQKGTQTTQTKCGKCPYGFYSNTSSMEPCKPFTNCSLLLCNSTIPGTNMKDNSCLECPDEQGASSNIITPELDPDTPRKKEDDKIKGGDTDKGSPDWLLPFAITISVVLGVVIICLAVVTFQLREGVFVCCFTRYGHTISINPSAGNVKDSIVKPEETEKLVNGTSVNVQRDSTIPFKLRHCLQKGLGHNWENFLLALPNPLPTSHIESLSAVHGNLGQKATKCLDVWYKANPDKDIWQVCSTAAEAIQDHALMDHLQSLQTKECGPKSISEETV